MFKARATYLIIVLLLAATLLPSCTSNNSAQNTSASSSFAGMLGMIPYSFFEGSDIQYANFGMAKELHEAPNISSVADFAQLSQDEKTKFSNALNEISNVMPSWASHEEDVAEFTGISIFNFNRIIYISNMAPKETWIAIGNFNEALIEGKLTGLGYSKTEYGKYSYYGIRDNYEIDIMDPLGQIVMAGMNRIAVLDNMLIISPDTKYVTDVLDTMEGKADSILNDKVCQALADSLGEVLAASLTTPERIINSVGTSSKFPFSFTIPENWGQLRGYEAAGLGYHAEGDNRYFNIALDYKNKSDAETDEQEITKRMLSYSFTMQPNIDVAFTDVFNPMETEIEDYGESSVLKINYELIQEEKWGILPQLGGGSAFPVRDLLFLAPDPSIYVK